MSAGYDDRDLQIRHLQEQVHELNHRNDRLHESLTWALRNVPALREQLLARIERVLPGLYQRADWLEGRWFGDLEAPDAEHAITLTGRQWSELLTGIRLRRNELVQRSRTRVRKRGRRLLDGTELDTLRVALDTEEALSAAVFAIGGRDRSGRERDQSRLERVRSVLTEAERVAEEERAAAQLVAEEERERVERRRETERKREAARREARRRERETPAAAAEAVERLRAWQDAKRARGRAP